MRTCIACGAERPKRALVRVVRTPEGEIIADATGRRAGRGAYLDPDPACLDRGVAAGRLARALEADVPPDVQARLREQVGDIARQKASPS